jgi:hypothetical protein
MTTLLVFQKGMRRMTTGELEPTLPKEVVLYVREFLRFRVGGMTTSRR